jgi:hypothetical protein
MQRLDRGFSALALVAAGSLAFSSCSGGSGTPTPHMTATPVPTATPTGAAPTPTPTGSSSTAFTCPSSDTSIDGSSRASGSGKVLRRAPSRVAERTAQPTGLLAVRYDRATVLAGRAQIALREASAGATLVREFDFTHTGVVTRVVRVAPSQATSVAAAAIPRP